MGECEKSSGGGEVEVFFSLSGAGYFGDFVVLG